MKTLTVTQLRDLLADGAITLIDVRGDDELALASIDGALHLPMHELPNRLAELDRAAAIAVLCHHGVRSEMAARFLEKHGFGDVASVAGGIEAWSAEIDAGVPRY